MLNLTKKKIVVTVVGVVVAVATFMLGGDVDVQKALVELVAGDLSALCQGLEAVPDAAVPVE